MPDGKVLDDVEGDVRFHHITPELWILEARQCARRWVVFHETYSFCLVVRIEEAAPVAWRYRHRLYMADRSHAMMMQPGELHANLTRTPRADFIVVHVAESLAKRVASALGWPHAALNIKHPHPSSDHPAVLAALSAFQRDLCPNLFPDTPSGIGGCTCWRAAGRHLENLEILVASLIQHCMEHTRDFAMPTRGAAPIRRAVEYLHEHYHEPYDLARLARAAGCSPFYLSRVFTTQMGTRPSDFKNKILVAKTCNALALSPDRPLELIASDIGWPERPAKRPDSPDGGPGERASLLIRHFRRTLGLTPGEFRAGFRGLSRKMNSGRKAESAISND